jgi:hypothetical protein
VEHLNGLYRRIPANVSQKGSAFTGAIGISDHVDFSDFSKGGKEFANLVLSGFS